MICDWCGEEMVYFGYDRHHQVAVYRCGCCAPLPEESIDTREPEPDEPQPVRPRPA